MDLDFEALRWRSMGWRGYATLALTLVLFFVTPWYVALFFAPASTIAAMATTLVSVIALRYFVRTRLDDIEAGLARALAGSADSQADAGPSGFSGRTESLARSFTWRSPTTWVAVFAGYTLLTNLWAASLAASLQVTLIQVSALLFFLLVWQHAEKIGPYVIPLLSLLVVALYIYGVGGALRWWPSLDAIYGKRELASVFQYHNTFGAVELALGSLAFLGGMSYRRWQLNIMGALGFALSIAGVVESQSRVAWVLAPVAYAIIAIIAARVRKSRWPLATFALLLTAGVGSAVLGIKALDLVSTNYGESVRYIVLDLVVSAVASIALAYFDQWVVGRRLAKGYARAAVAAGVLVLVAAAYEVAHHLTAHSGLLTRIESISLHSVSLQERFYYYKNAIPMWLNAPLFGAGGGAWATKFQAFQTIPYWSRQVHSVVFDQLLNGGLVGLLLFLAVLLLAAWRVLRSLRSNPAAPQRLAVAGLFVAAGVMLAHAAADFDFAFGLYQYLFWGMLALAAAWLPVRERIPAALGAHGATAATLDPTVQASNAAAPDASPQVLTASERRQAEQNEKREQAKNAWRTTGALAVGAVGAVATVLCGSLTADQVLTQWAAAAGAAGQGSYPLISAASGLAPYDAHVQLSLASYYLQTSQSSGQSSLMQSAWQAAQQAAADAPWDPTIQTQAAVLAYQLHHPRTAVAWATHAVQDAPFNALAYSNMMGLTMWYGAGELPTNRAQGIATLKHVLQIFSQFQEKKRLLNLTLFPTAPVMHRSASMQVYVGTADYLLGHYRASLAAINPLLKTATPDPAATYLYEADTVLDNAHLHPGKTDAQMKGFVANLLSNQGSAMEYRYLLGLRPVSSGAKAKTKTKANAK